MYVGLHLKHSFFLSDSNKILIFLQNILGNIGISNFEPVLLLGAESFHANGDTNRWTYITEDVVAFSNFVNVRKSGDKQFCENLFFPILNLLDVG